MVSLSFSREGGGRNRGIVGIWCGEKGRSISLADSFF